jgi:hypothetical protein
VTNLTIGEVEELWDEIALAEYPNRAALVAMSTSEAYAKIAAHRTAYPATAGVALAHACRATDASGNGYPGPGAKRRAKRRSRSL